MNNLLPEVGAWYQDITSGSLFEVVAIDEEGGTIEYQMIDGEAVSYTHLTLPTILLV